MEDTKCSLSKVSSHLFLGPSLEASGKNGDLVKRYIFRILVIRDSRQRGITFYQENKLLVFQESKVSHFSVGDFPGPPNSKAGSQICKNSATFPLGFRHVNFLNPLTTYVKQT